MSPTFLNKNGFRFFTHSNEENRKHVHVTKDFNSAKFWLEPTIELEYNHGFNKNELKKIKQIIIVNGKNFTEQWIEYFS